MKFVDKPWFSRLIDILAGGASWFIIITLLVLARFYPIAVSAFVTLYVVYWVIQSLTVARHSIISMKRIDNTMAENWVDKLQKDFPTDYKDIYQTILMPFANESIDVVENTVEKIANSNYLNNQKILALAPEEKILTGIDIAHKLQEKYQDKFYKIYVFPHKLVEGEIIGKASNQNNGARKLYIALKNDEIDTTKVIITSLDSDMSIHHEYLPLLTHTFLSAKEDRFSKIFQPIPMNLTGMWETAAPAHLISSFGVQWFLSLVHRPFHFINYSVYASCLESVHNAGYWPPDIIPEDERFYWQMYFYTKGKVEVVPLFVPIFGSVIVSENFKKTVIAQYDQIRRWAWGVSEIKFVVRQMIKDTGISWSNKILKLFIKARTSIEWVLLPLILGIGNFLPEWFNKDYSQSTIAFNIPILTSRMLTLTLFSFVLLVFIIQKVGPKKPEKWGMHRTFLHYIQWIIFPIVSIFFGSIPALDAQTRLLFGKSISYKAAPKTSK